RGPDPLLRHPADLRGRRQGAPDAAGLPLLPLAARAAHLPGDLGRHDVIALDHQHARRAARRCRAISPPSRHRRRFEHVRGRRLSWRDPKVSLLDLQYHDIRPDKGVYYRLVSNDHVDRITDDETIEQAKHVPPQTTRARLRGEFIRQANLKGKDYRVDWVYLKLNDPERETILCKDPFQSHDERVERLIRSF